MQRLSAHLREVVTYIYRTTVGPFREDRVLNTSAFWNRIHYMQFLIYKMCSFIPGEQRLHFRCVSSRRVVVSHGVSKRFSHTLSSVLHTANKRFNIKMPQMFATGG